MKCLPFQRDERYTKKINSILSIPHKRCPVGNHVSCIHHLGLDVCFDDSFTTTVIPCKNISQREFAIEGPRSAFKNSKLTKQTYNKTSLIKDVVTNQLLSYTKHKTPN